MTTTKTVEKLKKGKQHRAAFVASQISISIPFQVRALRKQRGWDQKRLAAEANMLQPRVSTIETPGKGDLNLDTLKRLAAAFDVALVVHFAPFSELARWSDQFSPDEFAVIGFQEELARLESVPDNVVALDYVSTSDKAAPAMQTGDSFTSYFQADDDSARARITEVQKVLAPMQSAA